MGHISQVTFAPVAWSDRVAGDLSAIADVCARDLAIFEQRTTAGEFQALSVLCDDQHSGSVLWCIEHEPDGKHALVVNAFAARPVAGVCLVSVLLDTLRELAAATGCTAFRCWTQRTGLVRKLEAAGCTRRYVMELEI